MHSVFRRCRTPAFALALAFLAAPVLAQQAPQQPDIDLKLFEKGEADRSKGCTVTLWQHDRDPEKDRYAIVFIEQLFGRDHRRQPARMKIGSSAVELRRVATGGKTNGYGLYEHQLYRLPETGDYVVADLRLGPLEGEAVEIEGGTLTVVQRGKRVFRASVKGGAGCMGQPLTAPPAPAQPVAPAQAAAPRKPPPAMFRRYTVPAAQIPRAFIAQVERAHACKAELVRTGTVGFQMSEESAIWQIPCEGFAYQTSHVFALVYLPDPAQNLSFLSFSAPPGRQRPADPAVLFDPQWNVATRTVTSFAKGRGAGDCGVLERHRVTEDGSFQLAEYREKAACDGKAGKPEDFPLVFRAP